MLQVKKLKLENIRKHERLEVDFDDSSSVAHLLIGKNGDGKTSVLRSIAMGLCNESDANLFAAKSRGAADPTWEPKGFHRCGLGGW